MNAQSEVRIVPIGNGGGWYHIMRNGTVRALVRGIKAAEAKATELAEQPETPASHIHPIDLYAQFIKQAGQ